MLKSINQKRTSSNLSCDEFYNYFRNLYDPDDDFYLPEPETSRYVMDKIEEEIIEMFNVLNVTIDISEVTNAINQLKRNKASGTDLLINELFMYGEPDLNVYLTRLFNYVFDSGFFPT